MRLLAAAILCVLPAVAFGGSLAGGSSSGMNDTEFTNNLIRCSNLPDPSEPEFTLGAEEDLHDKVTANCATGCIINIPKGQWDDTTVTIGPGSEPKVRAGSLTGATGTILIRGTDRSDPPVLRATIGEDTGVFWFQNLNAVFRLEDVILDGRRSEQTNGAIETVCTNVDGDPSQCDGTAPFNQSISHSTGVSTRRTDGGNSQSCLLRVQVRETVTDAIFFRQPIDTTAEAVTITGAGCTPELCPNISIPADASNAELTLVGRGVNFDSARLNSGVIESSSTSVAKIGFQCIRSTDCHIIGNTSIDSHTSGVAFGTGSGGTIRDNYISQTGKWDGTETDFFLGGGIQWSDDGTDGAKPESVVIDGNVIEDSFGAGITLAMSPTSDGNPSSVIVSRNNIQRSCQISTRPNTAVLELGDATDTLYAVASWLNFVGDHDCDSGVRAQRITHYYAKDNVVSGDGTNPAIIYDDVPEIDEDGPSVDEDINIDAGSSGSLTNCTLNDGASVSDSSGGAVSRSNCG